jgi:hypothetical protein
MTPLTIKLKTNIKLLVPKELGGGLWAVRGYAVARVAG